MKPREFHIWDLPEDKIRIMMKKKIMKDYFRQSKKKFGSIKAYSEFLNLPCGRILDWKRRNHFIPLWVIRKTIPKISWDWNFIENNIISYKGIRLTKPIKNPVLPIKENPELFEIMAHLICDGCVSKKGDSNYVNSNMELIENFRSLLGKCFGEVNHKIYKTTRSYSIVFSKLVSDLLKHFYNIEFESLSAYLPKEIHNLPEQFPYSVIRSIIDDEGSIRDNRITISMQNKNLISDIGEILAKLLGEESVTNPICRDKIKDYWTVYIRAAGIKKLRNKIKLIHPRKKYNLDYAVRKSKIKTTGVGSPVWDTKVDILKLLKDNDLSVEQLSKKFMINASNINTHLRHLMKQDLVKRKKEKYAHIWSITQNGLSFLNQWAPKNEYIKIMLPDWEKRFNLPKKDVRILLTTYGRKRLFWMLGRVLENQTKIGSMFNVHRNAVSSWKRGLSSISLSILNQMLIFLGENGIDICSEIENNVQEIRYLNGRYKIYEMDNHTNI